MNTFLKGARGSGTLDKEKPPIFGMIERGGRMVLRMLKNVQQKSIEPLIKKHVAPGTRVCTDEYNIYGRLKQWGYEHHVVCHARKEWARDDDGDGVRDGVHVNTIEGCWSLLRLWLRPHQGIPQVKLPLYVGLFEFMHNARRWGRAVLEPLLCALLCPAG